MTSAALVLTFIAVWAIALRRVRARAATLPLDVDRITNSPEVEVLHGYDPDNTKEPT